MSVNAINRLLADRVGPPQLQKPSRPANNSLTGELSFTDHLKKACAEIGCRTQFSGHAQTRVTSRQIRLEPEQLARIDRAVDSVAEKGAQRALVLLDEMALIVGVEKRTVVTLVDQPSLRDNVFTKIDAAVIA